MGSLYVSLIRGHAMCPFAQVYVGVPCLPNPGAVLGQMPRTMLSLCQVLLGTIYAPPVVQTMLAR